MEPIISKMIGILCSKTINTFLVKKWSTILDEPNFSLFLIGQYCDPNGNQ